MANTPTTTMRLDPELKDQAMKVLEEKHLEAEEYDLYDPYG